MLAINLDYNRKNLEWLSMFALSKWRGPLHWISLPVLLKVLVHKEDHEPDLNGSQHTVVVIEKVFLGKKKIAEKNSMPSD